MSKPYCTACFQRATSRRFCAVSNEPTLRWPSDEVVISIENQYAVWPSGLITTTGYGPSAGQLAKCAVSAVGVTASTAIGHSRLPLASVVEPVQLVPVGARYHAVAPVVKLSPPIVIEVEVHAPFGTRAGPTSVTCGGGVAVTVKVPGVAVGPWPVFHCAVS